MEDHTTQSSLSPFEEASKALLEVVLGSEQTDLLAQNMSDYFQLLEENSALKGEVASLKEILPFKDKYGNLKIEFQKVASERDSLRAKELEFSRLRTEYEKLKAIYQSTKGQLAAVQGQIENTKSSTGPYSALESLYQTYRGICDRSNIDIRRIPTLVTLQFTLQDESGRGTAFQFRRTSATNWKRVR